MSERREETEDLQVIYGGSGKAIVRLGSRKYETNMGAGESISKTQRRVAAIALTETDYRFKKVPHKLACMLQNFYFMSEH